MSGATIQELKDTILELKSSVDLMAMRQEEMQEDVKKIKEAVYNPDSGIYARLRALEQWKASQAKFQWGVIMSVAGLITASIYNLITGG